MSVGAVHKSILRAAGIDSLGRGAEAGKPAQLLCRFITGPLAAAQGFAGQQFINRNYARRKMKTRNMCIETATMLTRYGAYAPAFD